ncbi:hypothetical protein EDEG_02782 [Edhazardia aedis USNM 41457]|uniref:Transcription initiation factor TFIID subunit 12 domain-containing protein n=1 Tax=Edhazardia aedis (strain USNM 41457) TaxID=1003232 RepID=J9D4U6_EDHAE|nr:hypothetical protein EDEG_02782 [Edhazardia aedis USNM 41457]|eukprot:EJW02841.1 hypothetical protein EDEG_02782 [Edhazardia aedis USNM 41457]
MDRENFFIPKQKMVDLFNRNNKEKIEKEVIQGMQMFSEKFVSDILNRTILFTKHRGSNIITSEDILFTVEKEFDYSFGGRFIKGSKSLPTDDHVEKMAEISRQK